MLGRTAPETPSSIGPSDRAELEAARVRHSRIIDRADQAIHDAMQHADSVFLPIYRGPDRRRRHR